MTDTHQLPPGTRVVHKFDLADDGTIPPGVQRGTVTQVRPNGQVMVQWHDGGHNWVHNPARLVPVPGEEVRDLLAELRASLRSPMPGADPRCP